MSRGLVIIGGGPAGHAAAEAFRARGGTGPVVLVLAEGRRPYNRPPLSKALLRGEAGEHDLPLQEPDWYAQQAITLRPGVAAALDRARRAVVIADGDVLPYDTCILATGAAPVPPPVAGTEEPGVHVLRTAEHALALRAAAQPGADVVIVGSGFIGCEAAASLRARGCRVTLVSQEPAPQRERLGGAVAARLAGWLEDEGVSAHYETDLERIERRDGRLQVMTAGQALTADLVLLASGVRARAELAADAGLALAEGGEIPVDAHMRTDLRDVLACGDCALAHNATAGRRLHVEHWGDALGQGAVAGATAAGHDAPWDEVPGFWSTIGTRTLKYAAWGDGFDDARLDLDGAGFTAWYARAGRCVGVLTHERDADYERGRALIAAGEPPP